VRTRGENPHRCLEIKTNMNVIYVVSEFHRVLQHAKSVKENKIKDNGNNGRIAHRRARRSIGS
jgi:hypothetical protein